MKESALSLEFCIHILDKKEVASELLANKGTANKPFGTKECRKLCLVFRLATCWKPKR